MQIKFWIMLMKDLLTWISVDKIDLALTVSILDLRNSRIVEQKVPYTPFQDIDIYTMSQAKKMEEAGVMDDKPTVKKSDSYKQYMKQEMNIKPGSPLTRSNFKLIDIWNRLQNTDGVYEIPYKFGQSFAYPDLIRVRDSLDV